MTRINSAIPVQNLTDEHLLAEHREIKRLPAIVHNSHLKDIPEKFCLGKGHVKFFLNKLQFVYDRYNKIHSECLRRGFAVTDYSGNWMNCDSCLFGDHVPTKVERQQLIDRISERILKSPKKNWHYCGCRITSEEAVNLLSRRLIYRHYTPKNGLQ